MSSGLEMKDFWLNKEDCTGCGMCANICPKGAIRICEDDCGFYYPVINKSCINCNICETACRFRLNINNPNYDYPQAYACWSNNADVRFESTSGGAFSEIVKPVLSENGYVAGAIYDDDCRVIHTIIDNKSDLPRIRRSKYVQSFSGDIYYRVKKLLEDDKKVVFCGAPCQVAALLAYLKKPYEKLYTIDFICRGVNSPKAYRSWLKELEKKHKAKAENVWFKYKDTGWKASPYCTKISFAHNKELVLTGAENLFMNGYLRENLYIRPSCGNCSFKGTPRLSDITLADYWGVEPEIDDDRGISLVLINSNKGNTLLDKAKRNMTIIKKDFDNSIHDNPCYSISVRISEKSERFLRSLSYYPFSKALKKFCCTDKSPFSFLKIGKRFAGAIKRALFSALED